MPYFKQLMEDYDIKGRNLSGTAHRSGRTVTHGSSSPYRVEREHNLFYVISPPERNGWRLNHEDFARHVAANWPSARFSPPDPHSTTDAVAWDLPDPHAGAHWLKGSLDREGEAVYLKGDIELVAEFDTWLRQEVDPSQPLVFCDEAMTDLVVLDDRTSADGIVQAFSG